MSGHNASLSRDELMATHFPLPYLVIASEDDQMETTSKASVIKILTLQGDHGSTLDFGDLCLGDPLICFALMINNRSRI